MMTHDQANDDDDDDIMAIKLTNQFVVMTYDKANNDGNGGDHEIMLMIK